MSFVLNEHVPDQDVESILNDLAAEPAWRSVRSEFIWRFVIESAFSTLEGESKAITPSSLASCVSIRVRGGDKEMTESGSARFAADQSRVNAAKLRMPNNREHGDDR